MMMLFVGIAIGIAIASLMKFDNLLKVKTWVLNLWEKVKK